MQSLKVVRKWPYKGLVAYVDKNPEDMVAGLANEQTVSISIFRGSGLTNS
jgi:hypothetical protein